MVKRLRSVPAPQTMVANAVPAPVFGPISQVGEHHFRRVLNGIRRPRGVGGDDG